jgi:hypothetical protein
MMTRDQVGDYRGLSRDHRHHARRSLVGSKRLEPPDQGGDLRIRRNVQLCSEKRLVHPRVLDCPTWVTGSR